MLRNLHHANLLVGTPEEAEFYLRSLCDGLGIELPNNPDFFTLKVETFGIDEARELRVWSTRKAVTLARAGQSSSKIFLIMPARLTLEAQNALLKTFEEPFSNTYFFLSVREESLITPTLRSRMQTVRVSGNSIFTSAVAEKFLSLSFKDRLIFAKEFADEEKNLTVFLDDLLLLLRKRSEMRKSVEKIYTIRRSIGNSVIASRLVIEHLSLVLQ